jgi:phosphatidylserine decarboxylase
MLHEALMITSLSCIPVLLYRPAVGWIKNKRRIASGGDDAVVYAKPRTRPSTGPAASVLRSCGRWLSAWLVLHVLILLALVRGISSGGGVFAPELDKWQLVLIKKLPARALTRLWGRIALIYLVPVARRPVLGIFCALYGIKLDDVKRKDLKHYSSLHDFFTRTLKEETRPICPDHSLVSPVDGTVMHVGKIEDGEVKQVKGVNYKLISFLGTAPLQDDMECNDAVEDDDDCDWPNDPGLPRNDSITTLFQRFPHLKPSRGNELYHAVVYLSVSDYHHFHSPADWTVHMRRHVVGELAGLPCSQRARI